ncbi:MAG TPA: alpha/beta fold hydrolase [Daejeonella sp.]|nr:alpha/beta fold hydrolase [Daejeonella sp.]
MKKYLLLGIALFISLTSSAQNILSLINRSNEFFEILEKEKFEEAHQFFDESVQGQILPAELKLFWTRLGIQLGDFESVDGAQNQVQDDLYLVTLNCSFTKGSQAFRFVYTKEGKLVGFFAVPQSNTPVYASPAYADSALYKETNITIKTPGHDLAGILTTPKNGSNFPVVVLVHGSGPSDMDETIGPNKPFRDLALGLAAKGIATIRYVKRTLVFPTEFAKSFTVKEEVLDDAQAAINYAKTIAAANKQQIYVFGHSLGGMLAPKLATLSPDLKGIVLAAAPARKLTDLLIEQNKYLFENSKDTTAEGKMQLQNVIKEIEQSRITKLGKMAPDSLIIGIPAAYWVDLNLYDQVAAAKKLKNRILIFQGENDFQVSVQDYNLWKAALNGKSNVTFKLYPELNHLLSVQTEKGTGAQYYQKAGNVADYLIDDLAAWIKGK